MNWSKLEFWHVLVKRDTPSVERTRRGPKAQRRWKIGTSLVDMCPGLGSYTHCESMA